MTLGECPETEAGKGLRDGSMKYLCVAGLLKFAAFGPFDCKGRWKLDVQGGAGSLGSVGVEAALPSLKQSLTRAIFSSCSRGSWEDRGVLLGR